MCARDLPACDVFYFLITLDGISTETFDSYANTGLTAPPARSPSSSLHLSYLSGVYGPLRYVFPFPHNLNFGDVITKCFPAMALHPERSLWPTACLSQWRVRSTVYHAPHWLTKAHTPRRICPEPITTWRGRSRINTRASRRLRSPLHETALANQPPSVPPRRRPTKDGRRTGTVSVSYLTAIHGDSACVQIP